MSLFLASLVGAADDASTAFFADNEYGRRFALRVAIYDARTAKSRVPPRRYRHVRVT